MNHKISRPILEKIIECLDEKIKNIHPVLRQELILHLQTIPESNNVVKCKSYVVKLLGIPEQGRHTKRYWTSRGWSEAEAYAKSKQNAKRTNRISPYSREFWIDKINPKTGVNYTDIEADYERNSRRPIKKEYWIKLGYTEEEAKILASKTKENNNKKGMKNIRKMDPEIRRVINKRCVEYWINLGFSEQEAIEQISKEQTTFSLSICIEKYGEDEGKKRWLERQEKWHKSFKKSNFSKISQELFWEISKSLENLDFIYFAELGKDKTPDYSGTNNEYRLKLDKVLLPDFIDIKNNKIIEFDGIYWHGNIGRGNKTRGEEKVEIYTKNGYSVLSVCEKEFRTNKKFVIEQCLNFLKK